MTQSSPQLVDSIISIFLIVKLMTVGHPMGKRYLDEICSTIHPNLNIQVGILVPIIILNNCLHIEYWISDLVLQ